MSESHAPVFNESEWVWSPEELRRVGYQTVDLIADHVSGIRETPVFRPVPLPRSRNFSDRIGHRKPVRMPMRCWPTSPLACFPIRSGTGIRAFMRGSIRHQHQLASSGMRSPRP